MMDWQASLTISDFPLPSIVPCRFVRVNYSSDIGFASGWRMQERSVRKSHQNHIAWTETIHKAPRKRPKRSIQLGSGYHRRAAIKDTQASGAATTSNTRTLISIICPTSPEAPSNAKGRETRKTATGLRHRRRIRVGGPPNATEHAGA